MIRVQGTVVYLDGRVETFDRGNSVLLAWERYARRHEGLDTVINPGNAHLANHVIAHAALNIAEGFDVWLPTVDGVEIRSEGVPPTLTAVSAGP